MGGWGKYISGWGCLAGGKQIFECRNRRRGSKERMSNEAFTGKFIKSLQHRVPEPTLPAAPHRRLHNRGIAGTGALPGSEHYRGRSITAARASRGPGHHRDRGITGTGALPGLEHHRGWSITGTRGSRRPGHNGGRGIAGTGASPGPEPAHRAASPPLSPAVRRGALFPPSLGSGLRRNGANLGMGERAGGGE